MPNERVEAASYRETLTELAPVDRNCPGEKYRQATDNEQHTDDMQGVQYRARCFREMGKVKLGHPGSARPLAENIEHRTVSRIKTKSEQADNEEDVENDYTVDDPDRRSKQNCYARHCSSPFFIPIFRPSALWLSSHSSIAAANRLVKS